MGCCVSSSGGAVLEPASDAPLPAKSSSLVDAELDAPLPKKSSSQQLLAGGALNTLAHERLRKLEELDAATKVPFISVELTGEGDGEGEIEICGKDEYGVYEALHTWLLEEWGCEPMDAGDLDENTKIPFCRAQYRWPGFHTTGDEGMTNMGLKIMQLIDFASGQLSWTLAMVNGGNVGEHGEVREQQIIFKAPHPMNLVAPHMMIELRSAGYIEVSADLDEADQGVLESLEEFLVDRFHAQRLDGFEEFCHQYYKVGDGIFKGNAASPESNLAALTAAVCDRVVTFKGWSLVASCSGNYGGGDVVHEEQQMVFRQDHHPLGDESYILLTLNSGGRVEVSGQDQKGIHRALGAWLSDKWQCRRTGFHLDGDIVSTVFTWDAQDFMAATSRVTKFFEMQGWELQVCSRQMVADLDPESGEIRYVEEQQMFFRPGATDVGTIEPHLFFELYAGEGQEELYDDEETTQVLGNQLIRVFPIGPKGGEGKRRLNEALASFHEFVLDCLGGHLQEEGDFCKVYDCHVFMCRGRFENNLGQWTMRLCDFLVDRLGWSFMTCSLCNKGDQGQLRSQQLVFRYDGDKRDVPVSTNRFGNLDPSIWEETGSPSHWSSDEVLTGRAVQKIVRCTDEEKEALQLMIDGSFKRTLTRDRAPDDDAPDGEEMPYRLEVVDAFRSEHAWLNHRLVQRRAVSDFAEDTFEVKTAEPIGGTTLAERLDHGDAYLLHGTNPSSAMSILKTGFVLDHAGSATGTMFGAGIYMAERSSKSDEYGRDDGGNTYPGLRALLVCRCFVGRPYVAHVAGDHVGPAREGGFDCVCGDRESKVGTYREFVFFQEEQIYPEYTVIYRRQYDPEKVPEEFRVKTTGTTGRFWQLKRKGEWVNVPAEVNKALLEAAANGEILVTISLGGTEYTFSIEERLGYNGKTGNKVPLRPPMHR